MANKKADLQKTKLQLLERIAALNDPKQLEALAEMAERLELESLPWATPEEQALIEEGEADIAAGRVGTLKDLRKAMREGIRQGLKDREERLKRENEVPAKRKAA